MSYSFGKSIVTDGLVFYVDAGNDNSYPGTGTTWSDLIGGNDGTLEPVAGPTYDSANGGSIAFDGADDYVNCGNDTSVQITGELTQEAWFKSSVVGQQAVIYKDDATNRCYKMQTHTSGSVWPIYFTNNSAFSSFYGTTNVCDGSWHHIVTTYTPSTLVAIYVDGSLDVSTASSVPAFLDNDSVDLELGRKGDGTLYLNGSISQVKIYNRALSSTEILQNYNALKNRFI